ncbi:hypothetical protein ONZ45_g13238 [Pleurotus djamor]|nr:hypothetical protein ONZ45_g13238 [Pleurotus djamor]
MLESIRRRLSEATSPTVANIFVFSFLFFIIAFLILGAGLLLIFLIDGNFNRLKRPGGILTFKFQTTVFETLPIDIDWKFPPEPRSLWARCFYHLYSGVMVFVSPTSRRLMEEGQAFARNFREVVWYTNA